MAAQGKKNTLNLLNSTIQRQRLALHYAPLPHKGDFPNILVFTLGLESAPARREEGQHGIAEG